MLNLKTTTSYRFGPEVAEHPPGADGVKVAALPKGRESLEFILAAAQAGRWPFRLVTLIFYGY